MVTDGAERADGSSLLCDGSEDGISEGVHPMDFLRN